MISRIIYFKYNNTFFNTILKGRKYFRITTSLYGNYNKFRSIKLKLNKSFYLNKYLYYYQFSEINNN